MSRIISLIKLCYTIRNTWYAYISFQALTCKYLTFKVKIVLIENMKVIWYGRANILLKERIKGIIVRQLRKIPTNRLARLREYEETGDAIQLDRPRPEEGVIIKVVRHKGKLVLVAELYEHGYSEEYYVGELAD